MGRGQLLETAVQPLAADDGDAAFDRAGVAAGEAGRGDAGALLGQWQDGGDLGGLARAQLVGAQAQRDLTQLSLERTEIRSPIDGIADIASVSVGDIVSAGPQTVLTTVTQLDPIYVDVAESRARILRNRRRAQDPNYVPPSADEAVARMEALLANSQQGRK